MWFDSFEFKPALWSWLVTALMVGVLTLLGIWQLERAAEKNALLQEYGLRNNAAVLTLEFPLTAYASLRYRKVRVSGNYRADLQLLLDNQVRQGVVGYNVITPFQPHGARNYVLIDRGWVPLGDDRSLVPKVDVTNDRLLLTGEVYIPSKAFSIGNIDEGTSQWPRVIQYLNFAELESLLQLPLIPLVIRLDASMPHGYLREWMVVNVKPELHLAYALQWFALALAAVVIFVVTNLKRHAEKF